MLVIVKKISEQRAEEIVSKLCNSGKLVLNLRGHRQKKSDFILRDQFSKYAVNGCLLVGSAEKR